jgi:hypothetical protein
VIRRQYHHFRICIDIFLPSYDQFVQDCVLPIIENFSFFGLKFLKNFRTLIVNFGFQKKEFKLLRSMNTKSVYARKRFVFLRITAVCLRDYIRRNTEGYEESIYSRKRSSF